MKDRQGWVQGSLARVQERIRRSETAKRVIRTALIRFGVDAIDTADGARLIRIPAAERVNYRPFYSPWLGADPIFESLWRDAGAASMLNRERLWVLYSTLRQALRTGGEIWEAGVYRGGTALFLRLARDRLGYADVPLRLFDTWTGMPETDPERDRFAAGAFADVDIQSVRALVGGQEVYLHPGRIPASFAGLEAARIAFIHVDVDLYRSVTDTLAFGFPRLEAGGSAIVDDFGFPNAPGCRDAVYDYFANRREFPLVLSTGQAIATRLPE